MKTLARRLVHFFWSSSLRRRLVVGITLTHAVLMSLFIADSYRHQRDFVHAAAKEQALALAPALAASSTPWVLANDSEGLAETLSGVRASPDVEAVMVLDPQLRVLAHQDPARVGAWLTDAHSRALLEPRSAAAHLLDTDGPVLDAVAPIVTGAGRTVGWARVRLGQERAAQTLVHLSRVGSLYLLLAIGLGGALAWLLAREVTADLRSLVGSAERVRAGEGTHNEVHRADELGRLATALNETMDTLLSQKRASDGLRAELQRREEHLERALTSANACLWEFSLDTQQATVWVRGEGGLGLPGERTREGARGDGASWLERIHPEDRPLLEKWVTTLRERAGANFADDVRLQHVDGRWLTFEVRGSLLTSESGSTLAGTLVDVTEARRREEDAAGLQRRLLEAQKMEALGRLAGGVAHDFNNMLAAIQAHADLARHEATSAQQREDLDTIIQAAQRAAGIAAQVLAFGRGSVVEPGAVEVGPVAREVTRLLEPTLKGLTLEVKDPGAPLWARSERSGLVQVLLNLCVNARDHQRHGRVTLELAEATAQGACASCRQPVTGQHVRLSVIDEGPGISADVLERIFEPFFTTRRETGGSGMGLAVVHGLVHGWQGHVQVESRAGRTAFHVWLPVAEAPPQPVRAPTAAVAKADGPLVLVVDDEPMVGKSLARVLRREGCSVVVADGVAAALGLDAPWAAVVTDYSMGDGTGLDLAKALRARGFRAPIVLMTGDPTVVPESADVDALLGKPLDLELLKQALRLTLPAKTG